MEIRCSFGLGFVQRSHTPLNCWGYESKTPIGRKQTWNHHIFCGFMKNWWTLVEFLDFHLGFCGLRFHSTNSSVVEFFLDGFHDNS